MKCPYCDFEAAARGVHAHLGQDHGDVVSTGSHGDRFFYFVTCPQCGSEYQHLVAKGARDPAFIEEFDREIRMVALDMLVHHLVAEHDTQGTGV